MGSSDLLQISRHFLQVYPPSIMDGAGSDQFLTVRCLIAYAKSLHPVSPAWAVEAASEALVLLIDGALSMALDAEVPWALRGEPALATTFERARRLGQGHRLIEADLVERRRCRLVELESARIARDRTTPSVQALLEKLLSGARLNLHQQTLHLDQDLGVLVGTNSRGMDYVLGRISLGAVETWRDCLVAGKDLGSANLADYSDAETLELEDLNVALAKGLHQLSDETVRALGFEQSAQM